MQIVLSKPTNHFLGHSAAMMFFSDIAAIRKLNANWQKNGERGPKGWRM